MVPSTKLITIREAAESVRAQGKHDQEIHPETADRLCEAVGARRTDSHRRTRTDSVCRPQPCHPSSGRCPMSRWKEFRREPVAGEWTRKQKRGYHRVRSLLWFWECHQFQVLWVTLSTAEGGDAEKLTYHHKQLRQRIERQLGFQGLEYYQVRTEEGHGVLHIFWAWRVPDGERARRFWISQEWLSSQWQALHGAPVVWIKAYQPSHRSRNRLSRYVISQYVQDQCGYVNMCWSWKRSLGFPISRLWEEMRHQWSTRNAYRRIRGEIEIPRIVFIKTWEDLLSGHPIWFSGTILQLVLGKGLVYQEV
jgi:hypothetical protein